jgi:predicted transcriptional regulator
MTRPVLISVKPRFALGLLDGSKTIELRRSFPLIYGRHAFVYASAPVSAVLGRMIVNEVQRLPVTLLWETHSTAMALTRPEFDEYVRGKLAANALVISSPRAFSEPVQLAELRRLGLTPPQSFCYLPIEPAKALAASQLEANGGL